jgi:hypothetical protein
VVGSFPRHPFRPTSPYPLSSRKNCLNIIILAAERWIDFLRSNADLLRRIPPTVDALAALSEVIAG